MWKSLYLSSRKKDESAVATVSVCPLARGQAEGGPAAFTRSASCGVERLEGDNNSQVKIQLFA